jgi:uncharacterized protein (DUF305 family)
MTTSVTAEVPAEDDTSAEDGGGRRAAKRRFGMLVLALAVLVGLLLGYAGGLLTPQLTRPGDNSVEAGFARDMTTHHAQAVEMGLIALQSGSDPEVRTLAGDIVTGQQGDIGTMQTWLRSWGLGPTGSQPAMAWMPDGAALVKNGLMPGMATPEELAQLRAAKGHALDVLFLQLMIKHHLGGVHMIDAVLAQTKVPDVILAATTMKDTQQTELANLQAALKRLGG